MGAGGQAKQMQLRAPASCWPLRLWKVGENVTETQASPSLNGKAEGHTRAGGRGKLCGLAVLLDSCHLPPALLLTRATEAEPMSAPQGLCERTVWSEYWGEGSGRRGFWAWKRDSLVAPGPLSAEVFPSTIASDLRISQQNPLQRALCRGGL